MANSRFYRWLRAGKIVAPYGYPLWALGTVAITLGTSLCGWIVVSSCWKATLRPSQRAAVLDEPDDSDSVGGKPQRIIYFQDEISEQNIAAYAIEPTEPGGDIKYCGRHFPPTPGDILSEKSRTQATRIRTLLTGVGVVLTLYGFVFQNIGIRELHWSAGLLQLGVTLFLALLRAWLRRNIGDLHPSDSTNSSKDSTDRVRITKLERGFGACELAARLTDYECYIPIAGGFSTTGSSDQSIPESARHLLGEGQYVPVRAIDLPGINVHLLGTHVEGPSPYDDMIRNVLKTQACLADCEPDGETTKMATSCLRAMEEIMQIIAEVDAGTRVRELNHFIHMVIAKNPIAGVGNELPNILALRPIRFPWKDVNHTRFLRAIIGFSRYAYAGPTLTSTNVGYLTNIFRLIGHCTISDLEKQLTLLKAWINPREIYIRYLQAPSRHSRARFASHEEYQTLVFGLPFSWDFQREAVRMPDIYTPEQEDES